MNWTGGVNMDIRNDGKFLVYAGVSSSDLGGEQIAQFRTGLRDIQMERRQASSRSWS
ncbi:MAG: hypothetical protein Q8807_04150 ['Waltheria sp.' little leaf phytoplasma]|nr:hypothetical protein ['Waltheria sp.' little leaf phytoplasma]